MLQSPFQQNPATAQMSSSSSQEPQTLSSILTPHIHHQSAQQQIQQQQSHHSHIIQYASGNNSNNFYSPSTQSSLPPPGSSLASASLLPSSTLSSSPVPDAITLNHRGSIVVDSKQCPVERVKEDKSEKNNKSMADIQQLSADQKTGRSLNFLEGNPETNSSMLQQQDHQYQSYTSVIQPVHHPTPNNAYGTAAGHADWNQPPPVSGIHHPSLNASNDNEFLQNQTYNAGIYNGAYGAAVFPAPPPSAIIHETQLLLPSNDGGSGGNFGTSCIQPPLPHNQLNNDVNSMGQLYQNNPWPGYYPVPNSFMPTEQSIYTTVESSRENNCFPYPSTDNLPASAIQPQQINSYETILPSQIENHLANFPAQNNYGSRLNKLSSARDNVLKHNAYIVPNLFQQLDYRDSQSFSYGQIMGQVNPQQLINLDSIHQTMNYPPNPIEPLYSPSNGIIPISVPMPLNAPEESSLRSNIPAREIPDRSLAGPSQPLPSSAPPTGIQTQQQLSAIRTLCAASTSGGSGGSGRIKKTTKLKSSTGAGGITRLVTNRESLKIPSQRHSPGSSVDGNGKSRKSRSRSITKESDDDKSMDDKEYERRIANNHRERIRVRDINSAFKELAKLCCQHMPDLDERSLTKLTTLIKAVELIPKLEEKVRQRNLDPKICLNMKRTPNYNSNPSTSSALPQK